MKHIFSSQHFEPPNDC